MDLFLTNVEPFNSLLRKFLQVIIKWLLSVKQTKESGLELQKRYNGEETNNGMLSIDAIPHGSTKLC